MLLYMPVLKTILHVHFDRLGIGITFGVCHFSTLKSTSKLFITICVQQVQGIFVFYSLGSKILQW